MVVRVVRVRDAGDGRAVDAPVHTTAGSLVNASADPARDGYALALAAIDYDPERLPEILAPYNLGSDERRVLATVLALYRSPGSIRTA